MPSLGGRAAPRHRRQRGGHAAVSARSASQLLLSLRKASRHEQVDAGHTRCKLSRAAQRKKRSADAVGDSSALTKCSGTHAWQR